MKFRISTLLSLVAIVAFLIALWQWLSFDSSIRGLVKRSNSAILVHRIGSDFEFTLRIDCDTDLDLVRRSICEIQEQGWIREIVVSNRKWTPELSVFVASLNELKAIYLISCEFDTAKHLNLSASTKLEVLAILTSDLMIQSLDLPKSIRELSLDGSVIGRLTLSNSTNLRQLQHFSANFSNFDSVMLKVFPETNALKTISLIETADTDFSELNEFLEKHSTIEWIEVSGRQNNKFDSPRILIRSSSFAARAKAKLGEYYWRENK